jgi:hypothetical protein
MPACAKLCTSCALVLPWHLYSIGATDADRGQHNHAAPHTYDTRAHTAVLPTFVIV